MAQFLTLLPVLLLVAAFNPIVCPSSQIYSDRRDRSPYIGSGENNPQYLDDSVGPLGSRLRKPPPHKEHNGNYRNHETSASHPHNPPNSNEQGTTDSIVDKNIRSVFSTNFGPGLYLFKNTGPYVNQPHFNSYTDQMVGDQPDPYPISSSTSSSSSSSSDKEFFKVQRSPNGKLSLVYNEDYVPKGEVDASNTKNESDEGINDNSRGGSGSANNESFENRFQTHFPGGLPLTTDKIETSNVDHNRSKDSAIYFPTEEPERNEMSYTVDKNDCVEKEGAANGKPFCTNLRNYPEKSRLEQIIKQRFSNFESFFGEDLVLPQNISQRMNNEPHEEFLCKSRTRVIYPQAGLNKDYNWLIIVNIPNYKQGIRIEECINEGSPCGESNGLSLPNHYTATCKQSYIYRSLVAYTNDTVIKDQFKMPSCCKCVLRTG